MVEIVIFFFFLDIFMVVLVYIIIIKINFLKFYRIIIFVKVIIF